MSVSSGEPSPASLPASSFVRNGQVRAETGRRPRVVSPGLARVGALRVSAAFSSTTWPSWCPVDALSGQPVRPGASRTRAPFYPLSPDLTSNSKEATTLSESSCKVIENNFIARTTREKAQEPRGRHTLGGICSKPRQTPLHVTSQVNMCPHGRYRPGARGHRSAALPQQFRHRGLHAQSRTQPVSSPSLETNNPG